MLRDTKFQMTPQGRKVVPFGDDEPATAEPNESLHLPSQKRRDRVFKLDLAALALLLQLAAKYGFADLCFKVFDDLNSTGSYRYIPLCMVPA